MGKHDDTSMRNRMVTDQIQARGVRDPRILEAFRKVKRHEFIDSDWYNQAYDDTPLNIGHGQTISQPFIVAFMIEMLDVQPGDRILEIGTGSGYQTALLAELVREVCTVEINESLNREAEKRLTALGYKNIHFKCADGTKGWVEFSPFDSIVVAAAAPEVPICLIEQLKPGGSMGIPVGAAGKVQSLMLIRKNSMGEVTEKKVELVRFVPLLVNPDDKEKK